MLLFGNETNGLKQMLRGHVFKIIHMAIVLPVKNNRQPRAK
jgi:hypothetical protein